MLDGFKKFCCRLGADENGASMVEYSVLVGIITAGTVVTIGLVGTYVGGAWTDLSAALNPA